MMNAFQRLKYARRRVAKIDRQDKQRIQEGRILSTFRNEAGVRHADVIWDDRPQCGVVTQRLDERVGDRYIIIDYAPDKEK